ncbi:MAG: glycoside hydrolase family 31 protein [archaeon]|nr:glycoside hydrolase family 31 protein [archaeon]
MSSGQANQQAEIDFVNGFLDRGIRVGAVDLDSGWSTGYNNFIWNTNKYPNATEMVDHFHSLGVRVILWVTSAINTDSSNFETAKENDYMLNNGRLIHWVCSNNNVILSPLSFSLSLSHTLMFSD